MSDAVDAELLVDSRCELAEGIQWHAEHQRVFWTDIHGRALWSARADGTELEQRRFDERLGSFVFDVHGNMLLALASGLHAFEPASGRLERISWFERDKPTTRMNDGRCDRAGQFVVGGVEEQALAPHSTVVRVAPDGSHTPLIDAVGCANGLAFSPDGRRMYFADTRARHIYTYDYDAGASTLGSRALFATLETDEGMPDGACVDAHGALWNAQFNGARVQQFYADGRRGIAVRLPVAQVTCCCFGGPRLDRLFISTGRERLRPADMADQPLAGGIFMCDTGILGLPEVRFAGSVLALAEQSRSPKSPC